MSEDQDIPLAARLRHYGRKAVKVGAEMAEIAVHFQKVTPLTVITVGAKLVDVVEGLTVRDYRKQLATWEYVPSLSSFNTFMFGLCKAQGLIGIPKQNALNDKEGPGHGSLYTGVVYGVEVAWIKHDNWIEGPWVSKPEHVDVLLPNLGRLSWEALGKYIQAVKPPLGNDMLIQDSLSNTLGSKRADEIYERELKPFLDRKMGRMVLFYGESGSGKSHLMRHIARRAGGLSLRMDAEDIKMMRDPTEAVHILRPTAVIVDDLCRVEDPDRLLTKIEALRATNALIMMSANDPSRLDSAVLRPRRFDEYIRIEKLDDVVIDKLIGDAPDEAAEVLRTMPVAYIDAFHEYRRILGEERAMEKVHELKKRHEMVTEMAKNEKAKRDKDVPASTPDPI